MVAVAVLACKWLILGVTYWIPTLSLLLKGDGRIDNFVHFRPVSNTFYVNFSFSRRLSVNINLMYCSRENKKKVLLLDPQGKVNNTSCARVLS